jgi:predicted transcriptional regulator
MNVSLTSGEEKSKRRIARRQIYRALLRHRGAMTEIADQLGITKQTVSGVLRGYGTSARIMAAALAKLSEKQRIGE